MALTFKYLKSNLTFSPSRPTIRMKGLRHTAMILSTPPIKALLPPRAPHGGRPLERYLIVSQPQLLIGDKAPALKVAEFVKGEPITEFGAGTVYVVECWATWCTPCVEGIPHLSHLQKTHPDVPFIAVSVNDDGPDVVKALVAEKGDEMAYRVALDTVPAEGESNGWVAHHWLKASGEQGIPSAFIIDREGRFAWSGHPSGMDETLAAIVDGSYDLAAAREARIRANAMESEIGAHIQAGDIAAALAALDRYFTTQPELEYEIAHAFNKLELLTDQNPAGALPYAQRMVETLFPETAGVPAQVAVIISEAAEKHAKTPGFDTLADYGISLALADEAKNAPAETPAFVNRCLAKLFLACGRKAEALERSRLTLETVIRSDFGPEMIAEARALFVQCGGIVFDAPAAAPPAPPPEPAAPTASGPAVICEGDVCRLVG